jgi:hypothetical protein
MVMLSWEGLTHVKKRANGHDKTKQIYNECMK